MKKRPMTEERKTSIAQRYDRPKDSLLSFDDPLKILRADFTLRELSVLTGLSLKTLQRQARSYNINAHTHKQLCRTAQKYLSNIPQTELVGMLQARIKEWLNDSPHVSDG